MYRNLYMNNANQRIYHPEKLLAHKEQSVDRIELK